MNFNDMINIYKKDNKEELKHAIIEVKKQLNGLSIDQTCKIYSSFLYDELLKRHVLCRLVNTASLGLNYEHWFVLVPDNNQNYLLSDLTFEQFHNQSFPELIEKGYQFMDNVSFNGYLRVFDDSNIFCDIDEVFNDFSDREKGSSV